MTMTDTTATTTATDRALTLPYSDELLSGLFAVAQHASKDDATPAIQTVKVTQRHFVATNRYTVGKWEHTTLEESHERHGEHGPANPDTFVLIPRVAAEWLAKQTERALFGSNRLAAHTHTVTFAPDRITIQQADSDAPIALTVFTEVTGNFPAVERLIPYTVDPDMLAVPVSLAPAYLDLFIKGAKRAGSRNEAMRFQFTKTDNPKKPGPVFITFAGRFVGLIQPNLMLR